MKKAFRAIANYIRKQGVLSFIALAVSVIALLLRLSRRC